MDYRDHLDEGMNQTWENSEFSPVAYQLIDGIDIMVERSGKMARWNGHGWSELSRHFPGDRSLRDAIAQARSFDTIETGWHVLTGPGIRSLGLQLVNPYCFVRPMLLPAKLLRIPGKVSREFITKTLDRHYIAGVLIDAPPIQAASFKDLFRGNADLIEMVRMGGQDRIADTMAQAQS